MCSKVVDRVEQSPNYVIDGDISQVTLVVCCIPLFVIIDRQSLNQGMTSGEIPGRFVCEWVPKWPTFLSLVP